MTWWLENSQRKNSSRILMHFTFKYPLICRWSSHLWSHKILICTGLAAMFCSVYLHISVTVFISTFAKIFHVFHHISLITFNIPAPQNWGIPQNHRIVWIRRDYTFPLLQPLCHEQRVYAAQVGCDVETNPIKTSTKSSWNSNKGKSSSCKHHKNLACLPRTTGGATSDLSQQNPPQKAKLLTNLE